MCRINSNKRPYSKKRQPSWFENKTHASCTLYDHFKNKARRQRKKASAANHHLKVKIIENKSTLDYTPPPSLSLSENWL